MAVALVPDRLGDLIDPHGGAGDLEAGHLRVLHDLSFVDDPTRILRGLRYETRLGLEFEPGTEALASAAVQGGAMATISGDRLRVELLDLLAERTPVRGLEHLRALGIDTALDPGLAVDSGLVAAAALAAGVAEADPGLTGLAALVEPGRDTLAAWVTSLGLDRQARDAVIAAASSARAVAAELGTRPKPSQVYELLAGAPPETLALAIALGAPPDQVELYLDEIQDTALEISGADLIAEGLPESPELGRVLRETLHRKLDGELSGREQELRHALSLARAGT
jgi:tRNA nucleotidyltransferase (CCA-adding enzyme)